MKDCNLNIYKHLQNSKKSLKTKKEIIDQLAKLKNQKLTIENLDETEIAEYRAVLERLTKQKTTTYTESDKNDYDEAQSKLQILKDEFNEEMTVLRNRNAALSNALIRITSSLQKQEGTVANIGDLVKEVASLIQDAKSASEDAHSTNKELKMDKSKQIFNGIYDICSDILSRLTSPAGKKRSFVMTEEISETTNVKSEQRYRRTSQHQNMLQPSNKEQPLPKRAKRGLQDKISNSNDENGELNPPQIRATVDSPNKPKSLFGNW